MRYFCCLGLLFSLPALAQLPCDKSLTITNQKIEDLSQQVLQATQLSYAKVVDLKVKHAGTGDLSILVNEENEVVAVRFNYRDGKDVKMINVTADELNQGKSLQYPGPDGAVSPLRLSVVRPPGLNPGTGGTFNIDIATAIEPVTLKNYKLKLAKTGNLWSVGQGNTRVKDVIIHPGISWASWDGTFKKIDFQ
jgi:hypothetical protein